MKKEETKDLIKNVRFDFLRDGEIGCLHVEADCFDIDDLKEAFKFAKEASALLSEE